MQNSNVFSIITKNSDTLSSISNTFYCKRALGYNKEQ